MMNEQEPTPKALKKRSKIITVLAWLITACLVPICCAWIIGRRVYWFDIIASQQMLISWLALIFMFFVLTSRRWVAGGICLVLVCVSFSPVLVSREWTLARVNLRDKPDGAIRVVTCNINPKNETWREDLQRLFSFDADIIVLIEISPELNRSIRRRHLLEDTEYATWAHRAWVDQETSPGFILSRWAMERIDTSSNPSLAQHLLYTRVSTPSGKVIVGLAHPQSPRSSQRWANGNNAVQGHRSMIKQIVAGSSDPIVLCTDLNAAPAQYRASMLRQSGVRMSKPILYGDGSFPADTSTPRFMRVQLDDVWSTGNIEPIAWSMIHIAGSDHQTVVVDFMIVGESD